MNIIKADFPKPHNPWTNSKLMDRLEAVSQEAYAFVQGLPEDYDCGCDDYSLSGDCIGELFTWHCTPLGFDFWSHIDDLVEGRV